MKKILVLAIVLYTVPVIFTGCTSKEPVVQQPEQRVCISDSMHKLISLDTARINHVNDQLTLSGEVSFDEDKVVKLFPFSSGQVVEVKVSTGDKVYKGQTLAILKSADVSGSYSDLKLAGSDISIAKREYDNTRALYDRGISSEKDVSVAKANYEKAVTSHGKLNDLIQINGGGHTGANGTYEITAPAAGYIVEKNITAGSFIRGDNTNSLFTISDLANVWIWANVFEADIPKVKEGYAANITTIAYPGKVFHADIDKVSELLDPQNKVMRVRMHLPNPGFLLKPQMFTNVSITHTENDKVVSVASNAVIFDNGNRYVVLYHDSCHLEIKQISVLKTVGTTTYLAGGLSAGDIVISQNQILLYRALTEQ